MIKVSVVMPAFNSEKTIEKAISSVLSQTYGNFELIIVDDCSVDGTSDIIEAFKEKDSRIIHLKNERNSGVSFSRNYAIKCACGDWIAFLDSDDMWTIDKLEKQINLINKNPEAVLTYTASSFISENEEEYGYILHVKPKIGYSDLLKKNLISCSSAMVKASVMKNIAMPNDKMHEDYYVWLNILKQYEYAYGIDEPLLIYRLSATSKSANRLKSAKMLYNTYKAVGYPDFVCFMFICRYTIYSVKKRYKIKKSIK